MRGLVRRHGPSCRAFTLVEVVVAISIALGLIGTVLAFYDYALSIRAEVTDEMELVNAERIIMERMTSELRGAIRYPFISMGMEGGTSSDPTYRCWCNFITVTIPGPAAWAVRKSTDDPIPPEHDLELVGYRLRVVTYDDGTTSVEGLERTSQKILAPDGETQEGKQITVSFLTSHIKFLYLRYWDGANWLESWTGGDLPRAVEITMGPEPLEDNEPILDYLSTHTSFRRMVYLPGRPMMSASGGAQTRPSAGSGAGP